MKRRVLIVDDDTAILEVLEMRLLAMGFEVTSTPEAIRALQTLETTRFDLALLDLRMEPMNGIQLMEALHARQPRLPVKHHNPVTRRPSHKLNRLRPRRSRRHRRT